MNFPTNLKHDRLKGWVQEMVELCKPDDVSWCDSLQEEYGAVWHIMVEAGTAIQSNVEKRPNSYLVRSDQKDVARIEDRTFICSHRKEGAGPTNNWIDAALRGA